jgi:hypothetical protein
MNNKLKHNTSSPRVLVIHWNAVEVAERAAALRDSGFTVETHWDDRSGSGLRRFREAPPEAIVVGLDRLPSQGRAVAIWFRRNKSTRLTPLVFAGGDAERVAAARTQFPDARFATWRALPGALRKAIAAKPLSDPVVPGTMSGYAGTPLPKKLGIKPGTRVLLLGAPARFDETLGELPPGATLARATKAPVPVVLLFVRSGADLATRFVAAAERLASPGVLWIVWPKKSSPLAGDVGELEIRAFGLARDFVDYKICAVDADWSGLAFSRRRQGATRA